MNSECNNVYDQYPTLQGLGQDLESGSLKLAIVKYLGVPIFKGDHKILIFQPKTCTHLSN